MPFRIVPIDHQHYRHLVDVFDEIVKNGDDEHFHPHPFTQAYAIELLNMYSKDVYMLAISNGTPLAYGMLRGWHQGFTTPFLGIYVSPVGRGTGIAKLMMEALRFSAYFKGAKEIKLKVHKTNTRAINLYKSLGYEIIDFDKEFYIGTLKLEKK